MAPETLSRSQFGWVAVSLAAMLLPHVLWMAPGLLALILVLIGLNLLMRWLGRRRSPLLLRLALIALVLAAVILTYGNPAARQPAAALLAALLAVKLWETDRRRDGRVVVCASLFLGGSQFLFNEQLAAMLLTLALAPVPLAALIAVERRQTAESRPPAVRRLLGQASLLLLQAVPLALAAFLFLPRLSSPLWGVPEESTSARTGLGDSMTPGSISELMVDDRLAMRVEFLGETPARSDLYYRGPVLSRFDGQTWRASPLQFRPAPPQPLAETAPRYRYEIMMEPTDRRGMTLLDRPLQLPEAADLLWDQQVIRAEPVDRVLRFQAESVPSLQRERELSEGARRQLLHLPPDLNPRALELAEIWRRQLGAPEAIAAAALAHFRREPFSYTLVPPLLGRNSVDEFLFETRAGFCEHYASAFTVLMRAAGIPARVVTGYQGGSLNRLYGYWMVRYSDAHAWSEIWIDGQGWQRVDPTAAVAPDRIDMSARATLGQSSAWEQLVWLQGLRQRLDGLNRAWRRLVLEFDALRQSQILEPLGIRNASWRELGIALAIGALIGVALAALWVLWPRRVRSRDRVLRAYLLLCRRLARAGLKRAAHEGPRDFGQRACAALPQQAGALKELFDAYTDLRYGPGAGLSPAMFIDGVRKFRPEGRVRPQPTA